MNKETKETLRIFVYGRVQGVGFRRWLQEQAFRHGVRGWTRNREDGSVEALLYGETIKVHELMALCRKGPVLARVDRLRSETTEETEAWSDFRIEASV